MPRVMVSIRSSHSSAFNRARSLGRRIGGAKPKQTECWQVTMSSRLRRHQIGRELIGDELVVGQIVVERGDDPITVQRHAFAIFSLDCASILGKACHIEPRPGLPLAIVRRGEQAIDDFGIRLGSVIGEEVEQVVLGRRQSG